MSIIYELQCRIEELEKENRDLRVRLEQLSTIRESLSYEYTVDTKLHKISGIGLAVGCWNGKYYTLDAVRNCPTFKDLPILVEHGDTEEYGDTPVGRIEEWIWDDTLNVWKFTATITNDKVWNEILEGKYTSVSPRFTIEFQNTDNRLEVVRISDPIELSLTSTPACRVCNIVHIDTQNLSVNKVELDSEVESMESELRIITRVLLPKSMLDELVAKKKVVIYYPLPTGYFYYYRYPYYEYPKLCESRLEVQLSEEYVDAVLILTEEELEELKNTGKVYIIYYYYGYPSMYGYTYAYPPILEPIEKEEESSEEECREESTEECIEKEEENVEEKVEESSEELVEEESDTDQVEEQVEEEEKLEEIEEEKELEETEEISEEVSEENVDLSIEDITPEEALILFLSRRKSSV